MHAFFFLVGLLAVHVRHLLPVAARVPALVGFSSIRHRAQNGLSLYIPVEEVINADAVAAYEEVQQQKKLKGDDVRGLFSLPPPHFPFTAVHRCACAGTRAFVCAHWFVAAPSLVWDVPQLLCGVSFRFPPPRSVGVEQGSAKADDPVKPIIPFEKVVQKFLAAETLSGWESPATGVRGGCGSACHE